MVKKKDKRKLKAQIWKVTKLLNKLLYEYEDEPELSIEVVDYLQGGGSGVWR
jgi:hypothetical protein